MRENVRAFEDFLFRPRAAVFRQSRELRTTVLGHEISMPAIVSSVGFLKTGHADGEAGVARAAGAADTIAVALADIRRRGLSLAPICPFVRSYLKRHSEQADLVETR